MIESGASTLFEIAIGSDDLPIMLYEKYPYMLSGHCDNVVCDTMTTKTLHGDMDEAVIAMNADGYPLIGRITDESSVKLDVCEDAQCSKRSTTSFTDQGGDSLSLAVGTDGFPVLSFHDYYGDEEEPYIFILKCKTKTCKEL